MNIGNRVRNINMMCRMCALGGDYRYVYLNRDGDLKRIYRARSIKGATQVKLLSSGHWTTLAETDRVVMQ